MNRVPTVNRVPTIWLVSGSTGEFDERKEWAVRAFTSLAGAQAFVAVANDWLRERGWHVDDVDAGSVAIVLTLQPAAPPFDPSFRLDYTGTRYSVGGPIPLDMPGDPDALKSIALAALGAAS